MIQLSTPPSPSSGSVLSVSWVLKYTARIIQMPIPINKATSSRFTSNMTTAPSHSSHSGSALEFECLSKPVLPGEDASEHRVTMLCARYWPDRHGGVEQRLRQVSLALAAAGCAVTVITEKRNPALLDHERVGDNLTIRRFPPLNPGRMWRVMDLMRVRWWCNAIRQSGTGGMIWATDPRMAVAACLSGRGGELIYNPAGCTAAMDHTARVFPQVETMATRPVLRWLDRIAYKRAGRVIVGSDCLKQQFARFNGPRPRVHIVPHGVRQVVLDKAKCEAFRLKHEIGTHDWAVGFVGRSTLR